MSRAPGPRSSSIPDSGPDPRLSPDSSEMSLTRVNILTFWSSSTVSYRITTVQILLGTKTNIKNCITWCNIKTCNNNKSIAITHCLLTLPFNIQIFLKIVLAENSGSKRSFRFFQISTWCLWRGPGPWSPPALGHPRGWSTPPHQPAEASFDTPIIMCHIV